MTKKLANTKLLCPSEAQAHGSEWVKGVSASHQTAEQINKNILLKIGKACNFLG